MQRALEAIDPGGCQVADVVFEAEKGATRPPPPPPRHPPPARTRRGPERVPQPLPARVWDLKPADVAVAWVAATVASVVAVATVAWSRVAAAARHVFGWAGGRAG